MDMTCFTSKGEDLFPSFILTCHVWLELTYVPLWLPDALVGVLIEPRRLNDPTHQEESKLRTSAAHVLRAPSDAIACRAAEYVGLSLIPSVMISWHRSCQVCCGCSGLRPKSDIHVLRPIAHVAVDLEGLRQHLYTVKLHPQSFSWAWDVCPDSLFSCSSSTLGLVNRFILCVALAPESLRSGGPMSSVSDVDLQAGNIVMVG